jgi:hypothetical protein
MVSDLASIIVEQAWIKLTQRVHPIGMDDACKQTDREAQQ